MSEQYGNAADAGKGVRRSSPQSSPFGPESVMKPSSNEGIIAQELSAIRDSLDSFDGALGDLTVRLGPVLGSEPVSNALKDPTISSISPLHDALLSINSRINGLRKRVDQLAARITL